MAKIYVGVLIDPHTRTVIDVELPGENDSKAFARLVDAEWFDCVTLRRPSRSEPGAALYVDDNGLSREGQKFWCFSNAPDRIYAGKGVITAVDQEGGTTHGIAPAEHIAHHIVWRNVRFAGIEEFSEENVEIMPGVQGFRLTQVPKFEPIEEDQ